MTRGIPERTPNVVQAVRLIAAGIVTASCCAIAAAAPNEPRLGHFTDIEIAFLMKHTPEINKVISSGAVVAYGNVIEPPILVTINQDRVYIGGVQVVPQQHRPEYFFAKRKIDRIHEQYFLEKRSGGHSPEAGARDRALDMMKSGEISKFEFKVGKSGLELIATSKGEEWAYHLDSLCPTSISEKNRFMLDTIFRAYKQRIGASGKPASMSWLHDRFADLKTMGIFATYQFSNEDESVKVKFPCDSFAIGYAFQSDTPRVLASEQRWKAKEHQTQAALDSVVKGLHAGQLLIYTFGFDKRIPSSPGAVKLLKDIALGKSDKAKLSSSLQDVVGLSPEQAEQLLEELR